MNSLGTSVTCDITTMASSTRSVEVRPVQPTRRISRFTSAWRAWSFAQPVIVNLTLPSMTGGGEQSFRCVSWRVSFVSSSFYFFVNCNWPMYSTHFGVLSRSQPDSCSTYAFDNERGEQSFRCVSGTGNRLKLHIGILYARLVDELVLYMLLLYKSVCAGPPIKSPYQ